MSRPIPKGTLVTLTTTNGGAVTARLLADYRPTYAATIDVNGRAVVILATRLATIRKGRPMNRLNSSTKALVDHAIRTYRTFDVLHHVEQSLTYAQYRAAEAYLARLQAEHTAKFGAPQ